MHQSYRSRLTVWTALGASALAICSLLGVAASSQAGAAPNYKWTPTYLGLGVGNEIGTPSCPTPGWCVATTGGQFAAEPNFATLSGGSWTTTAAPVPSEFGVLELGDPSCPAVGWCVAPGGNGDGSPTPMVETLSDGTWTPTVFTGAANLEAVSCVAIGSCTAVGDGTIETLSGGSWTTATVPATGLDPASAGAVNLEAIECVTAETCESVGTYLDAGGNQWGVIETLLGGTWSASTAPLNGLNPADDPSVTLATLACPGLNACTAVGTYDNTSGMTQGLIETLAAGTWTAQPAPLAGLNPPAGANPELGFGTDISCPSVGACVSVGSYKDAAGNQHGLIETLSDGTWSAATAPVVGLYPPTSPTSPVVALADVSCPAVGSCVAVGSYSGESPPPSNYIENTGLIETLLNGVWTATSINPPGGGSYLGTVACPAMGSCVSTGGSDLNNITEVYSGLIENQSVVSLGYWEVASDGGIFNFGGANFYNSMGGMKLNSPIVGMAATPDGKGYWLVASDGGVFALGDAEYYGSMGGRKLNAPVVGIAASPDGNGYWLVASDGGIFNFGDAPFLGSMGGQHLNAPIVGIATSAFTGWGYWEVASDGGIFNFGGALFEGSMDGQHLNAPVVGIAPTPDGAGYWEVASDGGIFSFGDAYFYGSMGGQHLNKPIVGIAPTFDGGGYWEVASDGGIFNFGDAPFEGSMGAQHLNSPVVGLGSSG